MPILEYLSGFCVPCSLFSCCNFVLWGTGWVGQEQVRGGEMQKNSWPQLCGFSSQSRLRDQVFNQFTFSSLCPKSNDKCV